MEKKKIPAHKFHLVSKKVYDKRKKDVEFYHYTPIEFIALINKLRQRVEELENELIVSKKDTDSAVALNKFQLSDFNSSWTSRTKICFILRCNNRPMDSYEIYMLLCQIDEKFVKLQRMQTSLSKILNDMSKSGRIIKIKRAGIQKLLFLLPHWIGKNGEPLNYYQQFIDEGI
jgi:hypothetical protein